MRVLTDTAVWFRFVRKLPQDRTIESVLMDRRTRRYLSALSSLEIIQKWRTGKLPCPDPQEWLDAALEGFEVIPVSEPIARFSGYWNWDHKDPADRIIAATAELHAIELWHTDTTLRNLKGFPQRYFKAPPP